MLANLIEKNRCVQNIVTFDMHTEQAAGYFDIPVDDVPTHMLFAKKVKKMLGDDLANCIVVAPDMGSGKRARRFADALGDLPVALIDKRRSQANVSEVMHIVGEPVRGKIVLINDDIIDTAGTILNAAQALLEPQHGAAKVYVMATHGVCSGDAEKNLATAGIPVLVTDTIPRSSDFYARNKVLTVVSTKKLLASTLYQQMRHGGSVSKLSNTHK
jgi:ribose-phosphate pyrophosphokinase